MKSMKIQKSNPIQSSLQFGVAVLLLLGAAANSQAEQTNILTATDTSPNSSFNSSQNWLYKVQPGSGTNYLTGVFLIRTPSASGNYTFLGDSLTISTGGAMTIKGGNANIITINNLTNSGVINNGINANNIAVIAGNMTVVGAASLHTQSASGDTRGITNNMNLFGSGALPRWNFIKPLFRSTKILFAATGPGSTRKAGVVRKTPL
jgi:hypothetical protein